MLNTIQSILEVGRDDQVAIISSDHKSVQFDQLRNEINSLAAQLRALGISHNDRVGIVLPNGPEMAVALLAVSSCATAAPLNPAYRKDEFAFYLNDLRAKALITRSDFTEATGALADSSLMDLTLEGEIGKLVIVTDRDRTEKIDVDNPRPDDIALVLHTSGTTSRPKLVPLSHRNLVISATNIRDHLQLTSSDRCLNVMPLFHIHGFVAALLSSLAAGSSVACTSGFDAFRFFEWIDELKPTWYTAVPTMHQLILNRSRGKEEIIRRNSLRFLRSSSASLPPSVMTEIEDLFRAPMIEAYGMTEASHQMTSNPLPPNTRKPGSVGFGTGVKIAIMNDAATELPPGSRGEVVIQGPNVTQGYEHNLQANEASFTSGWFRTGDQGYLDDDGYLYLTGRLKEIINRGGEKISPREVDEVFLQHPLVEEAVTFSLRHPRLGEDIGIAIILKEASEISAKDLRKYASTHLADFKIPRKIIFLDDIPKGPTGKLQRIGLAEQLGLEQ